MMPSKTAQGLERMILARVRDEGACPADMQAFARFDTGDIDANGVARVAMFAAELRTKYELADQGSGAQDAKELRFRAPS
jgi:hypothetical protein